MEIVVISSWYFFEVFNRNFICAMLSLPCLSSSDPVLTEFDENLFLNFSDLLIRPKYSGVFTVGRYLY